MLQRPAARAAPGGEAPAGRADLIAEKRELEALDPAGGDPGGAEGAGLRQARVDEPAEQDLGVANLEALVEHARPAPVAVARRARRGVAARVAEPPCAVVHDEVAAAGVEDVVPVASAAVVRVAVVVRGLEVGLLAAEPVQHDERRKRPVSARWQCHVDVERHAVERGHALVEPAVGAEAHAVLRGTGEAERARRGRRGGGDGERQRGGQADDDGGGPWGHGSSSSGGPADGIRYGLRVVDFVRGGLVVVDRALAGRAVPARLQRRAARLVTRRARRRGGARPSRRAAAARRRASGPGARSARTRSAAAARSRAAATTSPCSSRWRRRCSGCSGRCRAAPAAGRRSGAGRRAGRRRPAGSSGRRRSPGPPRAGRARAGGVAVGSAMAVDGSRGTCCRVVTCNQLVLAKDEDAWHAHKTSPRHDSRRSPTRVGPAVVGLGRGWGHGSGVVVARRPRADARATTLRRRRAHRRVRRRPP